MSHHALLEYIRQAKALGAEDEHIKATLTDVGWYRVDVQDALELYRRVAEPAVQLTSVPSQTVSVEPARRSRRGHLLAIGLFSFTLGFIGYFALIR